MTISRRMFFKAATYASLLATVPLIESCSPKENLDKILLIGIDGLRPDALLAANTPNIDKLVKDGAYSFNAQAGTYTKTGPGWSNILTGVWEDKHGVKDNTFKGANYEMYPSIFTRLEKYRPELKTVSVVTWKDINTHIVRNADKKIHHPYRNRKYEKDCDQLVAEDAVKILSEDNPDLMFVYFVNVDGAGHHYGYGPKVLKYRSEIELVDGHIGKIISAMRSRPNYDKENWLVITTSDHGGIGHKHGGQSAEEKTVPYILSGKSVTSKIITPAPTHVDVAATVYKHMGLHIDPKWNLDGRAVGIK